LVQRPLTITSEVQFSKDFNFYFNELHTYIAHVFICHSQISFFKGSLQKICFFDHILGVPQNWKSFRLWFGDTIEEKCCANKIGFRVYNQGIVRW
jgi:hypothetical protein